MKKLVILSSLCALSVYGMQQEQQSSGGSSSQVFASVAIAQQKIAHESQTIQAQKAQQDFLHARADVIARTCAPELVDDNVCVAISGGSGRAAIAGFHFLKSLERIGVLPAVQSISALSGGTWSLAFLYSHAKDIPGCSSFSRAWFDALEPILRDNLRNVVWGGRMMRELLDPANRFIDVWSRAIGSQYFAHELARTQQMLSETASLLDPATMPLPIYASMIDTQKNLYTCCGPCKKPDYHPISIDPFVVRNCINKATMSTQTFEESIHLGRGQKFDLNHLLGLCGDAFELSLRDLFDNAQVVTQAKGGALPLSEADRSTDFLGIDMTDFLNSYKYSTFAPVTIEDALFGIKNPEGEVLVKDGGFISNIPLVCLKDLAMSSLHDDCRVIFVCDASDGAQLLGCKELIKAVNYCNEKKISISVPRGSIVKHEKHTPDGEETYILHVLYGRAAGPEGPQVPTILYMPNTAQKKVIKNGKSTLESYSSFQFAYLPEDFDRLGAVGRAVMAFEHEIRDVLAHPYCKQ